MADDNLEGTYSLQFGSSFTETKKDPKKFHALRYDFKPKSVSNNTDTFIAFGGNGDVHVAVPTDGESMTVYKGSKKDAKPKECLLFFDKRTGTVRLEKISSNINVKQTRDLDKATENVLRTEMAKLKTKEPVQNNIQQEHDSSSSSSSDSDSESHSEDETEKAEAKASANSSSDELENEVLAKVNAPDTINPSTMDDMPLIDFPRPISSHNRVKPEHSSHDRLGLNLSESSDDD